MNLSWIFVIVLLAINSDCIGKERYLIQRPKISQISFNSTINLPEVLPEKIGGWKKISVPVRDASAEDLIGGSKESHLSREIRYHQSEEKIPRAIKILIKDDSQLPAIGFGFKSRKTAVVTKKDGVNSKIFSENGYTMLEEFPDQLDQASTISVYFKNGISVLVTCEHCDADEIRSFVLKIGLKHIAKIK